MIEKFLFPLEMLQWCLDRWWVPFWLFFYKDFKISYGHYGFPYRLSYLTSEWTKYADLNLYSLLSLNSEIWDFLVYKELLNEEFFIDASFKILLGTDVLGFKDPERWAFYFATLDKNEIEESFIEVLNYNKI